jgi:hypothetical protein
VSLDRARVRRWRRDVYRAFASGGLKPIQIQAALVMAGVDALGTHLPTLSELTGLSENYARKVLRRLRRERILVGQTLRVRWGHPDEGEFAALLDAMVASGELARFPDQKRSMAQKARTPGTRVRGPRQRKATVVGPYIPKRSKSNPLYGLSEWETGEQK